MYAQQVLWLDSLNNENLARVIPRAGGLIDMGWELLSGQPQSPLLSGLEIKSKPHALRFQLNGVSGAVNCKVWVTLCVELELNILGLAI